MNLREQCEVQTKCGLIFICLLICGASSRRGITQSEQSVNYNSGIVFPKDEPCVAPGRVNGVCVPIRECQSFIDLILSLPKPLSKRDIQRLRKYRCTPRDSYNQLSICCPDGPIIFDRRENKTGPPDVSNHRNINLINGNYCGPLNQARRLLNGQTTSLFEYPWMALLAYKKGEAIFFACGGTLINSRYILTAAHCLTNLGNSTLLGARLGESNINTVQDCEDFGGQQICAPPVQDLPIEEVVVHPKYNKRNYVNDIGLIRLLGEADLEIDNVKPICLPVSKHLQNYNLTNRHVTVTGWGATEAGASSSELLQILLPVVERNRCKAFYAKLSIPITQKQLCAGGLNQRDSCKGDSGGPAQVFGIFGPDDARYFQAGIVSFGPRECGKEGFPGVFTNVAYYVDWILDNIRP